MNSQLHLGSREEETRVFLHALQRIFEGQTWDAVEPHARRAWCSAGLGDDMPWPEIEPRIREAWGSA